MFSAVGGLGAPGSLPVLYRDHVRWRMTFGNFEPIRSSKERAL